jgi:hypothetical protein
MSGTMMHGRSRTQQCKMDRLDRAEFFGFIDAALANNHGGVNATRLEVARDGNKRGRVGEARKQQIGLSVSSL